MRRVPWLALAALLAGLGIRAAALLGPAFPWLPGCAFKRLTGFPCATCGLTRCTQALGAGDWRGAFHWHPVGTVLAVLLPVAALWDLRRAWRGDAYPSLPEAEAARLLAWGLLAGTWLLQVVRGT